MNTREAPCLVPPGPAQEEIDEAPAPAPPPPPLIPQFEEVKPETKPAGKGWGGWMAPASLASKFFDAGPGPLG